MSVSIFLGGVRKIDVDDLRLSRSVPFLLSRGCVHTPRRVEIGIK